MQRDLNMSTNVTMRVRCVSVCFVLLKSTYSEIIMLQYDVVSCTSPYVLFLHKNLWLFSLKIITYSIIFVTFPLIFVNACTIFQAYGYENQWELRN